MSASTCRTATAGEVALMIDWAHEEGWNPGLDDPAAFHAADPGGFFVAEVDGAPVAAISVVNHSDHYAFLGLYLCRPDWRGKGIGFALWQHALAHADNRTVGLDGVSAQQANYARSGFVRAGSTRRLQGKLPPASGPARLATPEDIAAIARLDRAANGIDRPAFLSAWIAPSETRKTVLLETPDGIVGWVTARLCRAGCKIGPVIAPTPEQALTLAASAAAALAQVEAIIDVPDSNTRFDGILRDIGFTETFATARMYRGPAPTPDETLQAIATMELG